MLFGPKAPSKYAHVLGPYGYIRQNEAAEKHNINLSTLHRLVMDKTNGIRTQKIGGERYVNDVDLLLFLISISKYETEDFLVAYKVASFIAKRSGITPQRALIRFKRAGMKPDGQIGNRRYYSRKKIEEFADSLTRKTMSDHNKDDVKLAALHLYRMIPWSAEIPQKMYKSLTSGRDGLPPFFSEAFLYELIGKEEARTVLSLVRNLIRAAGISEQELSMLEHMSQEHMDAAIKRLEDAEEARRRKSIP